MEEAGSLLREMLQYKNAAELINIINNEVDTESISDFLATLCEQGRVQEAVSVLFGIACMIFAVQRLSTDNQGFHKQQKIYEWKVLVQDQEEFHIPLAKVVWNFDLVMTKM